MLPSEDPKKFQELLDDYIRDLRPATSIELDLVHEIAVCRWRIQRVWTMETCMFEINITRTERAAAAEFQSCNADTRMTLSFMHMCEQSRSLSLLHRYEARISRRFHQAISELKALQNQRKAEEKIACQTNSSPKAFKPEIVPLRPSPAPKKDGDTPSPPRAA